jgi:hypothetical protein
MDVKILQFINRLWRPSRYSIAINCPDDEALIESILKAAKDAGAGHIGEYDGVAMILPGREIWTASLNADPYLGEPGEASVEPSVRIIMQCTRRHIRPVVNAMVAVHPYEEPVLEITKLRFAPHPRHRRTTLTRNASGSS